VTYNWWQIFFHLLFLEVQVELIDYNVKLAAKDFSLTITEARALTEEMAKDENHAAVSLLNQRTMEYAIPFVTVDEEELEDINMATEVGTFPLTFIIDTARYNDSLTVSVHIVKAKSEGKGLKVENLLDTLRLLEDKPVVQQAIKMTTGIGLVVAGIVLIIKRDKPRS